MVHLVMSCPEFGLQVCRRMKVPAFLPGASPLDVIHADRHGIITCLNHGNIRGVSIATIVYTTGTISTLEFSANLKLKQNKNTHHIDAWKVISFYLFRQQMKEQ